MSPIYVVPTSILSVPYIGVEDFNKMEMKLTLISTFKYQVLDGAKNYPFLSLLKLGG